MKKLILIVTLFVASILSHPAQAYVDDLDGLLKQHVKTVTVDGIKYNGVDYDAWSQDKRHKKVQKELQNTDPATLGSKSEKLAFWINAYNVFTIDLLIQKGERDSIKDLGGVFESPWERFKWTVSGKEYTLDQIEHKIIRPLGEPRIHFAINCAAKSCPDLRTEAYRANKLNAQLADQTKKTFANPTKGYAAVKGQNAIRVTKVMDWFKKDFNNGDLRSWLKPYFPAIVNDKTKVQFFNYDWSLNKQ